MEIRYKGVDEGLRLTLGLLAEQGIEEDSRNGKVLRFPEPVMLVNETPWDRVSFSPARDANPFFHFMEALWMLGGMNELGPMKYFNSGIAQYSDDQRTLRGTAYGYKWRGYFGYDQLELAIKRLRDNPEDRRIVMTMWDPTKEWRNPESKDLSCNLQVIFSTRIDKGVRVLDMTVTNRSNDIIYGCLGSNVFHFSFLQEYVAHHAGLSMGRYYQFANNLHAYVDNEVYRRCQYAPDDALNWPGSPAGGETKPLLSEMGLSLSPAAIRQFVYYGDPGNEPYLKAVGVPLYEAYRVYKLKSAGVVVDPVNRITFAAEVAGQCADYSLASAAVKWLNRKKPSSAVYQTADQAAEARTEGHGRDLS